MGRKQILSIGIILVFLSSFTVALAVQARPPPEVVHFYRYLDDDASHAHYTNSEWGGIAYATHGSVSNIKLYTSTDGWLSSAIARSYVNGGINDNSPWTFSYDKSYGLKVYWEISGTFTKDQSNVLNFCYGLYHMSGSSKIYDMSKTYSYSSSFNYDTQTVSHYVSTASLSTSTDYYLECTIALWHTTWSVATSDMYFGANHIDFVKADFYTTFYY